MKVPKYTYLIGLLCVLGLLLVSCKQEPLAPLPQGPQTETGTLIPAEISLLRRGSHIFRKNGNDLYYVESSTVNLRSHERRLVAVTGFVERNTDPSQFPVFVAQSIRDLENSVREWSNRAMNIRLDAPLNWQGTLQDNQLLFLEKDSSQVILSIYADSNTTPPHGIPIVVGLKKAVRVLNEQTGSESVYIPREDSMLVLLFNPSGASDQTIVREQWLQVLHSVSFSSSQSSSPVSVTGSVVSGQPCGGSAGVLCPKGSYCEITDIVENIGKCKGVR